MLRVQETDKAIIGWYRPWMHRACEGHYLLKWLVLISQFHHSYSTEKASWYQYIQFFIYIYIYVYIRACPVPKLVWFFFGVTLHDKNKGWHVLYTEEGSMDYG
jgi:hypothetical protein